MHHAAKWAGVALLLMMVVTLSAYAGVDWKAVEVGNISSAIFNTGVVGFPSDPTRNPSGWWPAGTNDSYLYEGDIWIGAQIDGDPGVSIADGRQSELWPVDDVPEVVSEVPGTTTTGTTASQRMYFKCTDTNVDANKGTVLGIDVEANVFQWSYAPLYDFFIIEYRVSNVGSNTLENVYMGFRYDIDVSSSETGTASYSADDFVALDQTPDGLNPEAHPNRYLSYGFSNASAPGYIGIRVLDAYKGQDVATKIPFTAHKRITIDTDPTTDAEMYALLSTPGVDPLPAAFDDQRYIQSYGPVETLAPGEEFTVAFVVGIGVGIEGLRASVDWAQKLYDDGYVAPAPPPSPVLSVYPGDTKVTLVWDGTDAETYADATDPEKVFEGYRVYRRQVSYDNTTGQPKQEWGLLAEYDAPGATGNFFVVSHPGKITDATIASLGDEPYYADFFKAATYVIKFLSDTEFEIVNTDTWEIFEYNPADDGSGYTMYVDLESYEVLPDATYTPDAPIYFGGLYVSISGSPAAGDVFKIVSTPSQAIGEDVGLSSSFVDEDLMNHISYEYAVTSYDTGNPKTGLIAMESSKNDTAVRVFPRSFPAGYEPPSAAVEHMVADPTLGPLSNGEVLAEPIEPSKVTGHQYRVTFGEGNDATWTLTDMNTGQVVLEEMAQSPDPVIVEGMLLVVDGPAPAMTGEQTAGDGAGEISFEEAYMGGRNANAHDFEIRFVDSLQPGVLIHDVTTPDTVPFELWDLGYGTLDDPSDDARVWPMFYNFGDQEWVPGEDTWHAIVFTSIPIEEDFFANPEHDGDNGVYWGYDPADPVSRYDWLYRMLFVGEPAAGDVWRFASTKPNTSNDIFVINTAAEVVPGEGDEAILDAIRVVPNPYLVTNRSVASEGTDQLFFTNLPANCTIRIYTLAGEFVREIVHDAVEAFAPTDRNSEGSRGGSEPFDLLSYNRQALASGIYFYHVDAEGIGTKVGRFAVIR